ncbi:hypothetical protein Pan258_18640 [Symmachiella dynata]|nr:hypothetical protein Pan258_18640 [Symmachiella dynata]
MSVENLPMLSGVGSMMASFAIGIGLLTFLVHFAFAVGVLVDAGKQEKESRLYFVTEWVWFMTTLLGGVFVATAYWIMHHSQLCPAMHTTEAEQPPLS